MKIEQIESLLIGNGYVVRITTDTGLTGIGQTACWGYPTAVQSIVDVFKDYLIGQNPLRIEHHWQHLYRMAPFRGTAIMGAVSAVDIALWDIKGKHFEVPVWELLGGNVRDKIRLHLLSGGSTPRRQLQRRTKRCRRGIYRYQVRPHHNGLPRQGSGANDPNRRRTDRGRARSRRPGFGLDYRATPETDAHGLPGPRRGPQALPRLLS